VYQGSLPSEVSHDEARRLHLRCALDRRRDGAGAGETIPIQTGPTRFRLTSFDIFPSYTLAMGGGVDRPAGYAARPVRETPQGGTGPGGPVLYLAHPLPRLPRRWSGTHTAASVCSAGPVRGSAASLSPFQTGRREPPPVTVPEHTPALRQHGPLHRPTVSCPVPQTCPRARHARQRARVRADRYDAAGIRALARRSVSWAKTARARRRGPALPAARASRNTAKQPMRGSAS